MKYKISLHGCDDSTTFEMELTEEEYKLLKKVADKSQEVSTYVCMPIMEIEKV
ncbi:MAG: hypothetical protein H0Z24_07010 [Thermosipho sp. (in: Bacteria)]|nr:hypothetical protein [Thermosipho sp. (in: thermotogales)]